MIVPPLGVDTQRRSSLFWAEAHFTACVFHNKNHLEEALGQDHPPWQCPTTSHAQSVSDMDPQPRGSATFPPGTPPLPHPILAHVTHGRTGTSQAPRSPALPTCPAQHGN